MCCPWRRLRCVGAPDSVLIASTGVADSVIVVRAAGFSLSGGPIQRSVAFVYCWITFQSSVPSLTGLRAMNWKESYWLGGMRFPDQRTTATRSPSFWSRTFQPGASRTISDSTSAGNLQRDRDDVRAALARDGQRVHLLLGGARRRRLHDRVTVRRLRVHAHQPGRDDGRERALARAPPPVRDPSSHQDAGGAAAVVMQDAGNSALDGPVHATSSGLALRCLALLSLAKPFAR